MELSQLATILKEHGDQVLNAESKLSLSTKLLKDLNNSFNLVVEEREALSSTFQVISTSNSKVELLLDLQFLHDFVQRTVGLKLIGTTDFCDSVSVHKFKNLKLLELQKVPLAQLVGLQFLRAQLQYLTCVRCIHDLKELFITCGGDNSRAYIWSELKEAVLSYNNLETIDNSFEFVPWLQTLDISHNLISNVQAIDCLPNLKHLNLGFNHLETVPIFKRELFRNLQILILKSNYVGDLIGLLYLDNLVTLDLSFNCLIDHESLSPLSHLAALQWLNLTGNPLYFHPKHRNKTCCYLNSNTKTVKFILDNELLTKHEKKLIGTYLPSVMNRSLRLSREHQSSVCSNISDMTNSSDVTTIAASELTRSISQPKGTRIRDAIISENDENGEIRDDQGEIINPELIKSTSSIGTITLEDEEEDIQKKIENLRNQYGEDWLQKESGSVIQDIMGIERIEPKISSTPYDEDFIKYAKEAEKIIENSSCSPATSLDKAEAVSDFSANNTFVTASESFEIEDDIKSDSASICSEEEIQYEEDENEQPYLAQICKDGCPSEEVFVVISDKYLKERDTNSAKMKAKWLLEVILSCEIASTNPTVISIEFDTVRRNMESRIYILEDDEGKKFHKEISNIISQRPTSAIIQSVYCCMKCNTQFSREKNKFMEKPGMMPKCPNPTCLSTLVYEVDDESTPTNRTTAQNIFKIPERPESPSECSIASETESNQLAQIHVTAEVHMDNNKFTSVPANCSAASVQESNSSQISTDDTPSDTILRKYESDIEVISNPSQSSIEVLDDHFRPGRKRSSEERRTIMQPTLVTIPDITPTTSAPPALTESSSSSSFTESVCTAYDTTHHVSRPASGLEIRPIIKEETEHEEKKTIFSSLIEGLFSGPTTGKSAKVDDVIEFTFSDDFSNIDHRIKYYFYQHVFEDENENFSWNLKCVFLSLNSVKPIQGCLMLSTHKLYVLHIKDHDNGDDLSSWLIKKESYVIDKIQSIYILPWKQGIGLKIKTAKKNVNYLCILQDMQRTANFMTYLSSNPLPNTCEVSYTAPDRPQLNLQHLLLSHQTDESSPKDASILFLSVFPNGVICSTANKNITLGVFLVTSTDLILLSDLDWLLPETEKGPKIIASQPISNLLEIDLENLSLDFHFLDEIASCEEVWTIQFETMDSLNTAVSAVKTPWEKLFLVPMQVNLKVHSV